MPSSIQNSSLDDYSSLDDVSTDSTDSTDTDYDDFDDEMTDDDEIAYQQQQQASVDSFVDLRKSDEKAAEKAKDVSLD